MKHILTLTAALALTACGSDNNSSQTQEQAAETATEQTSTVDQTKDIATAALEKATEVAEALKLDTSSLDSFKSSLSAMQGSLNSDQATQLTDALGYLAKSSVKEKKRGLLNAAKSVASGKSMEDILYDNMSSQLNGLTFEEIIALAN